MIELVDGINYHNYLLDLMPEGWFKKQKDENTKNWLKRISYLPKDDLLGNISWRKINKNWIEHSCKISISILSFLRENEMEKTTLEDLLGFELNLKGEYDWRLSEISKLELILNKKLL